MFSSAPGMKAGTKNGKPWMWYQCMCPMKRCSRSGCFSVRMRCSPSSRMPVPQSRTMSVPPGDRTSTQEVLPPYLAVRGPGDAIEPRVPQKRTSNAAPLWLELGGRILTPSLDVFYVRRGGGGRQLGGRSLGDGDGGRAGLRRLHDRHLEQLI